MRAPITITVQQGTALGWSRTVPSVPRDTWVAERYAALAYEQAKAIQRLMERERWEAANMLLDRQVWPATVAVGPLLPVHNAGRRRVPSRGAAGERVHYLKTWPDQFRAVRQGCKRHEVRRDDRGFSAGDVVVLCEYEPGSYAPGWEWTGYTRSVLAFRIGWVTRGPDFGLPRGLCCFTLADHASLPTDWIRALEGAPHGL